MEKEALPNMAPLLQENALPHRKLLGIRPSEMDRHQTEPVPAFDRPSKKPFPKQPRKPLHPCGVFWYAGGIKKTLVF
jgi:hypothetical protein